LATGTAEEPIAPTDQFQIVVSGEASSRYDFPRADFAATIEPHASKNRVCEALMKLNRADAIAHLKAVRSHGPWTLSAIHPDRAGAPTATFTRSEEARAWEWIARHNGSQHGIYFCANPVGRRLRKRPREEDVVAFQYVMLDFDPARGVDPAQWTRSVRQGLAGYCYAPTLLWSSGNGIQAAWRIRPALMINGSRERIRFSKSVSRGLAAAIQAELGFESDSVFSIDHLFRLAGTLNFPNAAKREKGRVTTFAGDLEFSRNQYSVDDLPKAERSEVRSRGLMEPLGGWDGAWGLRCAILYCQTTPDLAQEGRSGTGIRTVLRMRDYGLSQKTALSVILQHWVPRCEYEWGEEELAGKVSRAYAIAENDPGCLTLEYRVAEARNEFTRGQQ
jgi:hypothetical protein